MATPTLARADAEGRRFYEWKGELFWSVTTIISGGVPKFLERHYAKMSAELALESILTRGPHSRAIAIVNRLAFLGRLDVQDRQARGELTSIKLAKLSKRDLALRWLKGAAERHRDAAAARGIDVHDEAEAHVLRLALDATAELATEAIPTPWPEHLAGYERSFRMFIEDWNPAYLATEATVFNRPQAYAGTLDAIVNIRAGRLIDALMEDGIAAVPPWLASRDPNDVVVLVLDYKAGNQVYAEVAMQDAAYAHGEFIGLKDGFTESPMPWIDGGLVLHLTPRGYHLKLVDIGEHVFDAFKYAREVYRYRMVIAPTVLSRDLAPKREKVAA